MDCLPNEILSNVFLYILSPYFPRVDYTALKNRQRALSYLALVCKHWKNAVFATPSLWSIMPINGRPTRTREAKRYLKHAKGGPLDLMISTGLAGNLPNQPGLLEIMEVMRARAPQWRTLAMMAFASDDFKDGCFPDFLPDSLPNLVEANIDYGPVHLASTPPLDAPLLERLIFNGASLIRSYHMPHLRYLNVQIDFQAGKEWRKFMDYLHEGCPLLEDLRIGKCMGPSTGLQDWSDEKWRPLPNLQKLQLWMPDIFTLVGFIYTINAPILKTIEVQHLYGRDNGVTSRLGIWQPYPTHIRIVGGKLPQVRLVMESLPNPSEFTLELNASMGYLKRDSGRAALETLQYTRNWLESHSKVQWVEHHLVPRDFVTGPDEEDVGNMDIDDD